MVNHISRHSPEFQAFAREGRRRRRPTSSSRLTRSGRTAPPPAGRPRPVVPAPKSGPFRRSRRRRHRRHGLDDLRRRRALRADRHRLATPAAARPDHATAGGPGSSRRVDGPSRRRRLRRQEGRARPASWWSPRSTTSSPGPRRSRRRWADPAARDPRRPATHEQLTAHGHWTYDFVLPGLLLHALTYRRDASAWSPTSPRRPTSR